MTTVWILARTLSYLEDGSHFWVYLNWALGLKECGCHVVWLETVPQEPETQIRSQLHQLRQRLESYGLGSAIALCLRDGTAISEETDLDLVPLRSTREADFLLNVTTNQRKRCCPSSDAPQ